ncbi:MAG: poly-beta-1,6-N-acetyl-D-glucosamine synthase [Bacillus sp. (in: firmicutes)]
MLHDLTLFLFYYPLIMGIIWIVGGLVFYSRRERKATDHLEQKEYPFISLLIPAYNEEMTITDTIKKASSLNYPEYEVIVINDGSKDQTIDYLKEELNHNKKLRVVNIKENKGKANALKQGVLLAKGEFIATIDSDAILDKDALLHIMPHFITPNNGERVGAVTGNPRIRNKGSLLSKIQVVEFSSIVGLIKRTQRVLGKVMTVSGVFVVFRKKALLDVDFWDNDLITDDIGITWKLQRRFWDIRYEPKAICWMLVPETLKGIWKQRIRWNQGGIEVILRNWDILFDYKQRRLIPVLIEQVFSFTWAITWFISTIVFFYQWIVHHTFYSPILWIGNYLALIGLLQIIVSLYIERKYEPNIFKYYLWAIWYPLVYWQINAILVIFALPKGLKILSKNKKEFATWDSPDRGVSS